MKVGEKLKGLRLRNGLTLEELANRTELSKGFLSQLERDLTTTTVNTLLDILEVLGTSPKVFFDDDQEIKVTFSDDDYFVQESDEFVLKWLVPSAQNNMMEPIHIKIMPKGSSEVVLPFEGESFGYVIEGEVTLEYGNEQQNLHTGNTFYVKGQVEHHLINKSTREANLIWVVTPPIF